MKNIFIDHKRTVLQIARANDVDISVAANLADQMANEVIASKPVSYSLEGVEGWPAFVSAISPLTAEEVGQHMTEYNRQATEAARKGENWTL